MHKKLKKINQFQLIYTASSTKNPSPHGMQICNNITTKIP